MLDETLRATLGWVVQQVREYGKDHHRVFAKLRWPNLQKSSFIHNIRIGRVLDFNNL